MRKLLALICVALSIYSVLSSVQLDILVEPFVIAAVGRAARMCELYDARTDQFLRISLLKNNAPDSVIHTTHNRQTDLKYLMLNTLEEKLTSLDIRAELKLSALAGLIQVSGSGKFVGDKKHGARSVKVSLANLMTTLFEQIDLTGTEESNLIDLNVLANIEATHVVVGIQWGGNVFVSVEDTNYENEEHQNIQGSLGGKLSFLFGSISAEGEVKLNDTERNEFNKFSFELYGDVLPTITPTNLVEAIVAMKNSSRLLVDGNGGRGKAMSYHLLPITVFRDHMKVESQLNSYLQRIDDSTINACMRLFEEMEIVEEKIYDLMKDRNTFQHYLNKEKLDKIAVFANSFDDFKIKLKSTFVEHLILARSGNETIGEFLNVLHEGRQSTFSPNNIDFEQFYPIETEFRFLRHLVQLGVEMLDKRTSFQEFKSTNFGRNIYAFFYSVNFPTLMEEPMMVFKDIFSRRNTFDPLGIFVAVKIDVLREQERE
ncbi:Stonustoxin subunit beta, partial [Pseudolycoriella hygida]